MFDEYAVENCKIELIENYPCANREELLKREGHHIKNNECLNRCVAGRTINEWKEDNKEHYEETRKAYCEKMKNTCVKRLQNTIIRIKTLEVKKQNKDLIVVVVLL